MEGLGSLWCVCRNVGLKAFTLFPASERVFWVNLEVYETCVRISKGSTTPKPFRP